MGEWSKLVGEHGENIVQSLLEIIGWGNNQSNFDMPCIKPSKHTESSTARKSHGIDFLFSYKSDLEEKTVCHAIISSKFTAAKYPNNPSAKFKEHFNSLAMDIECFKQSNIRKENSRKFSASREKCIGVLFWMSNEDDIDFNVVENLYATKNIDDIDYGTIHIVDNKRAAFIFKSIQRFKRDKKISSVKFLYPANGSNNSAADRLTSGHVLPAEFLTSGIIPFSLTTEAGDEILAISCSEQVEEHTLTRIIGLAQAIAYSFPQKIIISLLDFNKLKHKDIVEKAKSSFPDSEFIKKIIFNNLNDDFRGDEL
ncbi:MAG: hypothetical protein KJ884_04175 [Gammaproteobacteria bacterium]|nr:hypothetical protein [Gammaproteobacteria bacterium]MBU1490299.1 hypothetical protein [Gammaproteobacteria bacterium]MBU2065445.1 hypothetical protein [Gammaproteobacteria bacterium]MBU2139072.1 hypothetical protein [Gammaproteobacteria bacterium]MBU2215424.1 hypothetical protein [Gammaproteobacteria bacterium]